MRRGALKREVGELSRARQALVAEHACYQKLADRHARHPGLRANEHFDLLEGFAGAANPSRMAPTYGLRAMRPADIDDGWDLASSAGRELWKEAVTKGQPTLIVIGFPCTNWCIFNESFNCHQPATTPGRSP